MIDIKDIDKDAGESKSWVASPVLEEDDVDFSTTFCEYPEEPKLEVLRLCEQPDIESDVQQLSYDWHRGLCFEGEVDHFAVCPSASSFHF